MIQDKETVFLIGLTNDVKWPIKCSVLSFSFHKILCDNECYTKSILSLIYWSIFMKEFQRRGWYICPLQQSSVGVVSLSSTLVAMQVCTRKSKCLLFLIPQIHFNWEAELARLIAFLQSCKWHHYLPSKCWIHVGRHRSFLHIVNAGWWICSDSLLKTVQPFRCWNWTRVILKIPTSAWTRT